MIEATASPTPFIISDVDFRKVTPILNPHTHIKVSESTKRKEIQIYLKTRCFYQVYSHFSSGGVRAGNK